MLQAVRRNIERFPPDFMFQLTNQEVATLKSHIVTFKKEQGKHRKYQPYVFTEQGIAMLSSVIKSKQAIVVNIEIMRNICEVPEKIRDHALRSGESNRRDGEALRCTQNRFRRNSKDDTFRQKTGKNQNRIFIRAK